MGPVPTWMGLVAPEGTGNAGDAGIRVSGNLYIAALQVLLFGLFLVGLGMVAIAPLYV